MSSLAKRYKISDVALAKVCRKLLVTVPSRGYWARVEYGYNWAWPDLPKTHRGQAETAKIAPILFPPRELPDEVGADSVVRAIEIRRQSGIRQTITDIAGDRIIEIDEPCGSQNSYSKTGRR